MKFFWPLYLASAVIGSTAVYVAAPYARPYLKPLLGDGAAASVPAAEQPAAAVLKVRPAAAPQVAPAPAPAPAAAQPEEEDELPPALKNVYLASSRDQPSWGVTHQQTTYYMQDGSRVGTMPGGSLFTCRQVRQSSKGAMMECVFLQSSATNLSYLVSRKDVYLFTGAHTDLSKRQLEALKTYYALSGKIGNKRTELLQQSAAKNPHFASYNASYRTYLAHIEKAKELAARRDRATELDKARMDDQLREMKVEEVRIKAAYEAEHVQFRAWKEQHASELAKPESDPDVKRWTAEKEALRKLVPGLTM